MGYTEQALRLTVTILWWLLSWSYAIAKSPFSGTFGYLLEYPKDLTLDVGVLPHFHHLTLWTHFKWNGGNISTTYLQSRPRKFGSFHWYLRSLQHGRTCTIHESKNKCFFTQDTTGWFLTILAQVIGQNEYHLSTHILYVRLRSLSSDLSQSIWGVKKVFCHTHIIYIVHIW